MPKGKIIEIITKMLLTLCAERSQLWEGIASSSLQPSVNSTLAEIRSSYLALVRGSVAICAYVKWRVVYRCCCRCCCFYCLSHVSSRNAGAHNFRLGGKLLAVAVPCGSPGTRTSEPRSQDTSNLRQGILTFIFITRAYLFNCLLISEWNLQWPQDWWPKRLLQSNKSFYN